MTTLTIQITDDSFSELKEEAQSLGLTPEELARIAIEQAATPQTRLSKGCFRGTWKRMQSYIDD